MIANRPSVDELIKTGIALLCRELGPVNTMRFLHQYTLDAGNYTEERDRQNGNATVDEIVEKIKQRRK